MPPFENPGHTTLTDVSQLGNFNNYKIITSSPVTKAGIDLQAMCNISIGNEDFNGEPPNKFFLGACHY